MKSPFKPRKFITEQVALLSQDTSPILVAVSGGVDSTVCAVLLKRAKCKVYPVFFDTGFLREGERKEVVTRLKQLGMRLTIIDLSREMATALAKAETSAAKRFQFRKVYFKALMDYAATHRIKRFAQGTQFYSSKSKVYHNKPTNEFTKAGLTMIEVVKGLSKDNIRQLARALRLPPSVITRRPFPGPGLLVRFQGRSDKHKLVLIRKATLVVDEFMNEHPKYFKRCFQMFPYLSGGQATFVDKNGKGSVGEILLIRGVYVERQGPSSIYKPFRPSIRLESKLVQRLMNLEGVARIAWDVTTKYGSGMKVQSGATIEYE